MAEYYIKEEDGEEVIYEKNFLGDIKIGELHDTWSGSKETRNIFGPQITVDDEGIFSSERKAKIDEQEGVFDKDFLADHPTFKESSEDSSSSSYEESSSDNGGSSYSSNSSSGTGKIIFFFIVICIIFSFFIGNRQKDTNFQQKKKQSSIPQRKYETNLPINRDRPASIDYEKSLEIYNNTVNSPGKYIGYIMAWNYTIPPWGGRTIQHHIKINLLNSNSDIDSVFYYGVILYKNGIQLSDTSSCSSGPRVNWGACVIDVVDQYLTKGSLVEAQVICGADAGCYITSVNLL